MSSHDPSNGVPREPLEEEGHEKYAVVTEEAKTAAAKAAGLCPQCGRTLIFNDDKRNVPWCVHCGTHPFEPPTP
jgi:uncharacterized protein (DUF983 family)